MTTLRLTHMCGASGRSRLAGIKRCLRDCPPRTIRPVTASILDSVTLHLSQSPVGSLHSHYSTSKGIKANINTRQLSLQVQKRLSDLPRRRSLRIDCSTNQQLSPHPKLIRLPPTHRLLPRILTDTVTLPEAHRIKSSLSEEKQTENNGQHE